MRLALVGLLALTAGLLPVSHALKVVVGPGKTECVAETVDQEHFEVSGRPHTGASDGPRELDRRATQPRLPPPRGR